VHFHDTRGLAIANAYAALDAGVRRFDSSVGGIGGCPFAPGAAGNIATEDVVLLAQHCGFETGIDMSALVGVVDAAERLLGRPLGGRSIEWLRGHAADLSDPKRAARTVMPAGLSTKKEKLP
jgi:hydroxymethylglutaryl-CoA lyase